MSQPTGYIRTDAVENGKVFKSLDLIVDSLDKIYQTLTSINNNITPNPNNNNIVFISENTTPDVYITGTAYNYESGTTISYDNDKWTYTTYADETHVENNFNTNILYFASIGYLSPMINGGNHLMIVLENIVKAEGNYTPARHSTVLTKGNYALFTITDGGLTFHKTGYINITDIHI
ncbi:hypothetical protein [Hubei hepe-like virus 3]|uniref:hypothetical protein n=1 Tax=Hubei hepe-like virus 3 TaxID=1922896 RepID=UPI0009096CDD|nr:hypothetical protein [Hubei hepe-like virus 3]APG77800.1 hypothetical protein [Hubei hepe-like virus 3]